MSGKPKSQKQKRPPTRYCLERLGSLTFRSYAKPKEELRGGDLYVGHRFEDGSLAVLVGDVTDHDNQAELIARGVYHLFRDLCAKQKGPVNLIDLKARLDVELEPVIAKVVPDGGRFVQSTLLYISPPPESTGNDAQHITVHPLTAVVAPRPEDCAEPPTRTLASTALLLGIGIGETDPDPNDLFVLPITPDTELVVATDGLFEQPGAEPERHIDKTINGIDTKSAHSLFSQVLRAHGKDVKDSKDARRRECNTQGQGDDVLVISLRRTNEEDELAFGLHEGRAEHKEWFRQEAEKRLQNLVKKFCLKEEEEPEDVMHDLFVHLYANRHQYIHGSLIAWMVKSAYNFLVDRLRSKKRHSLSTVDVSHVDKLGASFVGVSGSCDPARLVELREALRAALQKCEVEKRRLWEIKIEGHDVNWPEVFQTLGIKPYRGREWLRELEAFVSGFGKNP